MNGDNLSDEKFLQIARDLNLNMEEFEKDMNDLKIVARINQDIRLGGYLGVRGTPTIYINGRLSKARTLEALQAEVEIELRKVKKEGKSKGRG